MAVDIFEKQRILDQLKPNKPTWDWATGYDEGNEKENISYQRNIANIFSTVRPQDDVNIGRVETRLNNLGRQYGNKFNEATVLALDEAKNSLNQFKLDNADFKNGYEMLLEIDNDAKKRILGTHEDPTYNIMALPQDEFSATVRNNATKIVDNLHVTEKKFTDFNNRFSDRLQGSPNIKLQLTKTMDRVYEWKHSIFSELSSTLGLKPNELDMIISNPELYKEYKNQKLQEFTSNRRSYEQQMNKLFPEFEQVYNEVKTGTYMVKNTLDAGAPIVPQKFDLSTEDGRSVFAGRKTKLAQLSEKGKRLNSEWLSNWYLEPEKAFYMDFSLSGLRDITTNLVEPHINKINSDPLARKAFEEDPKGYIELHKLPEGSALKIAKALSPKKTDDVIRDDYLKEEYQGGITPETIKSKAKAVKSTNLTDEDIEEAKKAIDSGDVEKARQIVESRLGKIQLWDIDKERENLSKGRSKVWINPVNSVDISLQSKKGYNAQELPRNIILKKMEQFNKQQAEKSKMTPRKAYKSPVMKELLKNYEKYKGKSPTKQKFINNIVLKYNEDKDFKGSFDDYLIKEYNI